MGTVVPVMGTGWEVNIARLIDKANDTLQGSANSRLRRQSIHDRAGSICDVASLSFSNKKVWQAFDGTPTTFGRDRSASYRGGLGDWDASLRRGAAARRPSQAWCDQSTPLWSSNIVATDPWSKLSPHAATRVSNARLDGLEERIRLEVQATVRKDVDRRVCVAQKATDSLRDRIEGIAIDLTSVGSTVRTLDADSLRQKGQLESLASKDEQTSTALADLKRWRSHRESWCHRTDDALASLAEDARDLARRVGAQQKTLDEDVTTRDNVALLLKRAQGAAEAATASAIAPVREHFLGEIVALRRRLSAAEEQMPPPLVPDITHARAESIAKEAASVKAKELWEKMEARLQESVDDMLLHTDSIAALTEKAGNRLDEVEKQVQAHGSALDIVRDGDFSLAEVPKLQTSLLSMEHRLADSVARMDEEWQKVSQTVESSVKCEGAKMCTDHVEKTQKLSDRIDRLERLERQRTLTCSASPLAATSEAEEKKEQASGISDVVQELVSQTAALNRRQTATHTRLEELSEQVCGHSLKLQCLDGLWRERGAAEAVEVEEKKPDGGGRGGVVGGGIVLSSGTDPPYRRAQEQQERQVSSGIRATGEAGGSSSITPMRTGLSSLLKRLGSTSSTSSAPKREVQDKHDRAKDAHTTRPTQPLDVDAALALEGPASAEPGAVNARDDTQDGPRTAAKCVRTQSSSRTEFEVDCSWNEQQSSPTACNVTNEAEEMISDDLGQAGGPDTTCNYGDALHLDDQYQSHEREASSGQSQQVASCSHETPLAAAPLVGKSLTEQAISVDEGRQQAKEGARDRDKTQAEGSSERQEQRTEVWHSASAAEAEPVAEHATTVAEGGEEAKGKLGESGSIDGSVHSRWSLPGTAVGGVENLHEQRGVWDGSGLADDSEGSIEQAPSSGTREHCSDGKSARSRVESYDLQQQPGDDGYILPFSPGRASNESDKEGSPTPASHSAPSPLPVEVKHSACGVREQGGESGASSALGLAELRSQVEAASSGPPLTPGQAEDRDDFPSTATAEQLLTAFDDDDDDDDDDHKVGAGKEEAAVHSTPAPVQRHREGAEGMSTCKSNESSRDNVRAEQGAQGTSGDASKGPRDPQQSRHQSALERLLDPLSGGEHHPGEDGSVGGGGRVIGHQKSASGNWAPPDFGFSSDDDDLLDVNLSVSESSSSRQAEGGGTSQQSPPPSSSPNPGSIGGFDTSTDAS